jgi:hypothetical protein
MDDPWSRDGHWLRCALHAHTTASDGELPPTALAGHYERAGYDVLATTDHWHITEVPSTERLVVIASVELNCVLPGARDGHVLGFGVRATPDELRELAAGYSDLAATGAWIRDHGGVAYLAHPYWTGVTPGTLDLPDSVTGIEVFNAGCELEVGRGLSAVHWDELLEAGRLCPGVAADDSHHPGFDSGFTQTWVRAGERTAPAVLEALEAGAFYSSAGPLLHDVRREGDAVSVRCSPCRSVTLLSGKSIGSSVNAGRLGYRYAGEIVAEDADGLIVEARLTVPPAARHVRVEVTDTAGGKAWANPIAV